MPKKTDKDKIIKLRKEILILKSERKDLKKREKYF